MNRTLVGFDGVAFSYGSDTVLRNVAFSVAPGTVTALMGPSGCGKSTVMSLAAGLLTPRSGTVLNRARRCAPVFQDATLLPWRNALDNVCFALKAMPLSRRDRATRAVAALASVGLDGADLRRFPSQLSGGMRQRVALARALVLRPDLLLLDEPFRALDPPLARRMYRLVQREVAEHGAAALVVTHDPQEAALLADQVVVLSPAPGEVRRCLNLTMPAVARDAAEISRLSALIAAEAEACGGAVRNLRAG